jgi:hypothetical protein
MYGGQTVTDLGLLGSKWQQPTRVLQGRRYGKAKTRHLKTKAFCQAPTVTHALKMLEMFLSSTRDIGSVHWWITYCCHHIGVVHASADLRLPQNLDVITAQLGQHQLSCSSRLRDP